jgi:hypothetical protein
MLRLAKLNEGWWRPRKKILSLAFWLGLESFNGIEKLVMA